MLVFDHALIKPVDIHECDQKTQSDQRDFARHGAQPEVDQSNCPEKPPDRIIPTAAQPAEEDFQTEIRHHQGLVIYYFCTI